MSAVRTRPLLALAMALLALNALLVFGNLWPGIGVLPRARVSVELAVIVSGIGLWVQSGRVLPARALSWLAGLMCFGVLWHYADVTSRGLLGRPVNLYWDGQHAWQVLRMAAADRAWLAMLGSLLGLGLLAGVLFLLMRALLGWLVHGLAHRGAARTAPALGLALVLGWVLAPRLGLPAHAVFAEPIAPGVAHQLVAMTRSASPERLDALLPASPAFDRNLEVLAGADVVVLFMEAYGAITLDDPRIREQLAPVRDALAQAIATSGREVVSARVISPTFGGASWLAHAALLSGLDTREPDIYAALLRSRRPTLVSYFAARGYRTVAWVPGIQRPWPEGRFWGFDRYGELDDIGYRGPAFGYWQVPDQAAMALLLRDELSPAARRAQPGPRFVVFPTVSTHAPFVPVAPIASDWTALAQGRAYSEADRAAALSVPENWTEPTSHYIAAFRYALGWLAAFVAGPADRDLVLVVIGDHQPIGAVTGPGAPWDVPVHVISRNAELLARLRAEGFGEGLVPPSIPLGPLQNLTPVLMRAFGDPIGP